MLFDRVWIELGVVVKIVTDATVDGVKKNFPLIRKSKAKPIKFAFSFIDSSLDRFRIVFLTYSFDRKIWFQDHV